ncbi:hypothetical protein [Cellulomonas soli]|uniref:hypothetical protein n=1 Tax=Cellulomonas soli TaxID=931535 RepID=UPI0011BE4B7A|nr:hypothetical protein [Cellulomonas soli]
MDMDTTHLTADRLARALALTTGGIDGLANDAGICDLRRAIAYAADLLADGSALTVAPTGGWFMDLALALGRAPSVLEVEARCGGAWWTILGHAYEIEGRAGLLTWGVPDDLLRSVEAELLEDRLGLTLDDATVGA